MKTRLVLLLFVIAGAIHGQWVSQTLSNQRYTLRKLVSAGPSHTWAVGDTGRIMFSGDKGKTWTPQNSGISELLQGAYFLDTAKGFAYGVNGTILTTYDAGRSWTKVTINSTTISIRSMSFSDAANGWFAATPSGGTISVIYRTKDGGKTWLSETLPSEVNSIVSKIQFVDTLNGWMVSSKKIYRTTNGGTSWTLFDNNGNVYTAFRDIHFFNKQNGYFLIDQFLKVYFGRTTNGGLTWNIDSSFTSAAGSGSPSFNFIDSLYGCAAGTNFIGFTADGGKNWRVVKKSFLNSACLIDTMNIAAVGNLGTKYYSTDQGKTWTDLTPPSPMTLRMVKYQSPTVVWAVGSVSTLLQSTDQGMNWKRINIPTGIGINGMTFPDTTHGWVLDDSARIFLTLDRGTSWIQQPTGLNGGLRGIYFTDSLFGCTVGDNGTTKITINGGTNWNTFVNATDQTLYDLYFFDRNKGWAVGKLGTIVRASNNGSSWKVQSSNTTATLRSISFSDSAHGVIVGDSGVVLQTIDGGESWNKLPLGNILNYRGVKLIGAKGWIVGDSGRIYSSSNSGADWNIQKTNSTLALHGVDFANAIIGTIVGEGTTVYITRNGGITAVHADALDRPMTFLLENNFPNPFNPTTQIEFTIAQPGFVTLQIFDVLGREVAELMNEQKEAGRYSVRWNGSQSSSGIYYYRLQSRNVVQVKKMLLLK